MKKSALYLNGDLSLLPDISKAFQHEIAADGAIMKLLQKNRKPNFVVGDFDSLVKENIPTDIELIHRPDQNFTDFHKSLEFALDIGIDNLDVFGATGLSHDHFLGNLTSAFCFKDKIKMTFYDHAGRFFFLEKTDSFSCNQGDMISFYPFYEAKSVYATNLKYAVKGLDFHLQDRNGTRNTALADNVEVSFDYGDLLVFVQK